MFLEKNEPRYPLRGWFTGAMLFAFVISFAFYVYWEKQIDRASEQRYQSYSLAAQLRQSSDDLTRMVRTYVVTGDPIYKQSFQDILDIRDGLRLRPESYDRIFWDLTLLDPNFLHPEKGPGVPLLELMRRSGFTDEEFQKLAEAKANSDELANREFDAMALVEAEVPEKQVNRMRAILMLHDDTYHRAKASIMKPIDEFYGLVEKRTLATVRHAENVALVCRLMFIALTISIGVFLWLTYAESRATLGGSVQEVHAQITRIGQGEFSASIPTPTAKEGSVIAGLMQMAEKLNDLESRRVHATTSLQESEQRYRSLFNNAEISMFRTKLDGSEVLDCNTKFLEMLGYSREEVIGVPSRILWVDPTERDKMVAQLQSEGRVQDFEFQMRHKGGDARWCVTSVRLFKVDGVLEGSIQDITERKRAEMDVLDKNAALERSNADLEQFAYVASHDLQTPLRNIVRYAQLLEHRYKNRLDADADDFIGFVVDSGKHMTRLINDLLEFSRVSRQSEPLKPISAGEALTQALKNLDLELVTTGAEVKVGDLPTVVADQTYLVSLFQNLLGNGLKYRAPDRKPVLSVSAERVSFDSWRFTVADNGIGIEPQYHDKIFEIFQRLDPASNAEGTGIGLTLCRRIVHRFGGNIWLKSEPGTGTTFFFTLRDGSTSA
jgi:PAS domain S-box-containing protein